jgi:uncharacterized protein YxeA
MKLIIVFIVSAIIVIVASLLASYANSDIGRYVLFPGLIIEVMISRNVHGGGFFSSALIVIASWLIWSFILYLGVEIFLKIPRGKKNSKRREEKKSSNPGQYN